MKESLLRECIGSSDTEHSTRTRSRTVPRVPRRGRGRTRSRWPTSAAPAPGTAPTPAVLKPVLLFT